MKRILSVLAVLLFFVGAVAIQNASPLVMAQSTGLGITPRKDLVLNPGEQVEDQLFISNLNRSEDLSLTLQILDFTYTDESGTPALQLDAGAPRTPWSLEPFISLPQRVDVDAGESIYVPFTVNVPDNTGAGSYYSAIRYVAEGPEGEGNVVVSASGASLVFLTVPGETNQSLNLRQFGAYEVKPGDGSGDFRRFFFNQSPAELAYVLQNNGTVAERPNGSIIIRNMFGKNIATVGNINPRNSLALIGQTRRFQVCIEEVQTQQAQNEEDITDSDEVCPATSMWPGRYTADLNILYGINGNVTQEIVSTATFWYLPVWFLVVVGVVVLALIIIVVAVTKKVRGGGKSKSSGYRSRR